MNFKHTKIACFLGLTVQAVINNFLPILFVVFQSDYNLGYERIGRLIFINFCTQLVADAVTPYIAKLLGYRKTVMLCHILAASGLILLCFLPPLFSDPLVGIVIPVIVYAFGSGIIEVIMSPLMESIPGENKRADMAFMHSFYCWGQAFTVIGTTVMVTLFGFGNWRYIPLIWAVIPVFNTLLFLFVPINEPKREKRQKTPFYIFKTREFYCFAVFMFCAGASEISMSEWASVFAQNALGVDKTVGDLAGPCAFAVFMGIGRLFYGFFAGRYSVKKALIVNSALCGVCYVAVGVLNIPAISLLACALCGFTVSLSWPGTYSLAAERFKEGGTLMFSIFALCGDMGCSAGPWLVGIIAERFDLKLGLLSCAAFPVIMITAAVLLLKENRCKNA